MSENNSNLLSELNQIGEKAKKAAFKLASLGTIVKNNALLAMAQALEANSEPILTANRLDVARARENGTPPSLLDRLILTEKRIGEMAAGLRQTVSLPDPIGEIPAGWQLANGLKISKVRVPLGVIGIIYESRPNVTVDAAALCLKAGNAVILRGGSEAIESNKAIVQVISAAAYSAGIPEGAIELIATTDRAAINLLLKMNTYLDVIIPRGGAALIKTVVEQATVPVIETGTGVCHTFVDSSADLTMAQKIAFNAKVSRPGVCNAMETLLVHRDIATTFLPPMLAELQKAGVELRGCGRSRACYPSLLPATEADWAAEYLDFILAVKVVDSLDEAIDHINTYGTKHSEAIVTRDLENARRFQTQVDAAAVYVNASTRFTDGFEFGFGAEIGISTQKLHARGPMGLAELTSIKYLVEGNGQIR
jgi:glutamate-5-semialdehyde dehydrogenase